LRADKIAMVSLAIVTAFLLMLILSASGMIAADWEQETGVSYAPPHFIGADAPPEKMDAAQSAQANTAENPLDPLKDVLRELRQKTSGQTESLDFYGISDPLAKEMADINSALEKSGKAIVAERASTLPFGADKWGHDIIKKTIKGAETSIVVGLVAAVLATLLGTLFGAFAGYFGGRTDDFFNWFTAFSRRFLTCCWYFRLRQFYSKGRFHHHPDSGLHRLDWPIPPDACRIYEAQSA
jgi:peptide/nickel transport system permease protein